MRHAVLCVAAVVAVQLGVAVPARGQTGNAKASMKMHPMSSAAERDPIEGELPAADYSDEHMNAALVTNLPNYASAIVTTEEVVEALSSHARLSRSA